MTLGDAKVGTTVVVTKIEGDGAYKSSPEQIIQSNRTSGVHQADGGGRQGLFGSADPAFCCKVSNQQYRQDHPSGSYRALYCGCSGAW